MGELALAITGWSVGYPARNESAGFKFRNSLHEPGTRTVLGRPYPQKDLEQGIQILNDLAVHPSCARFISTKLARHFIADNPPEELVNVMTTVWLETKGRISDVITSMIEHPLSWKKELLKFKTPREFCISSARAVGQRRRSKFGPYIVLNLLGQPPFGAGSPAGYPDTMIDWDGGEAMMTRIDWARQFVRSFDMDPVKVARAALGNQLTNGTKTMIKQAESRQQGLALFLLSPEFQRR